MNNRDNNSGIDNTLARIKSLPDEVRDCYLNQDIVITFSMFIEEVKRRCLQFEEVIDDPKSPSITAESSVLIEKRWVNIVYRLCMNFLNDNFDRINTFKFQDSPLVEYMKNQDLMKTLQTIVDIAQYNMHQERNEMNNLLEMSNDRREIRNKQHIHDEMRTLYFNFVDLMTHCTGTWNLPIYRQQRKNNFHVRRSGSKTERTNVNRNNVINRIPRFKHE